MYLQYGSPFLLFTSWILLSALYTQQIAPSSSIRYLLLTKLPEMPGLPVWWGLAASWASMCKCFFFYLKFDLIFTLCRGNINLPRIFPLLGKSQLQVLSVIVSILLIAGHILMASLVKERVLLKSDR